MFENSGVKLLYAKIQKQLFYMIPEKWDRIYLYASFIQGMNHLETGEMFFYYFPKSLLKKNPVNSYEIPAKFNLEEEEYLKLAGKLYHLIKQLRDEFTKNGEKQWTNLTIKIENFKFIVEFYYDELSTLEEVSQRKHLLWVYHNLHTPLESFSKKQRQILLEELEKEQWNKQEVQTYSEAMYKSSIKNLVQYHQEKAQYVSEPQLENQFSDAFELNKENQFSDIFQSNKENEFQDLFGTNQEIGFEKNGQNKYETKINNKPKFYKRQKNSKKQFLLATNHIKEDAKTKEKTLEEQIQEQLEEQKKLIKSQILNQGNH